jgi:hypothetical protein
VNSKVTSALSGTIAALLISSAAICAVAQSRAPSKQNTRQDQSTPPPAKQNVRESPSKQNARDEKGADAASTVQAVKEAAADTTQYSYEFKQPEFYISRILIEHDSSGRGRVSFNRRGEDEPIVEPLELSEAARTRILGLWSALKFLDSSQGYQAEKQFPHLGTMRLGMKQGERERWAEFNWTNEKDVSALVDEYRRAADQAIFIFDITLARQNQPLEAPGLMDRLETMVKRGGLSDPKQLVPLLRDLSTDERIPLMARNLAGRILKKIEK